MKSDLLTKTFVGLLLIFLAGFQFWSGRLMGRSGLTSLTRESHPTVFWTVVAGLAVAGVIVLAYAAAKGLGVAQRTTSQAEAAIERGYAARIYIWAAFLGGMVLLVIGSLAWVVYEELSRK